MIYFNSIQIKGYKGFKDSGVIPLCVPDGTLGSGLNILVGENGSGKTALLKAVSLLTANSFSGQSRISSVDFNTESDTNSPISIVASLKENIKYPMPAPWKQELDIKEFHILIKHRDRKAPGKLLSSQLTVSNILEPTSRTLPATKNREAFELTDFYLAFDTERLGDEALNIFFWDLDRSRQTKTGFSTTFSRVMDDLNWRFLKDANQTEVLEKWKEFYSKVIVQDLGDGIKTILSEKFNRPDLAQVKLQLLNLADPFAESFFAISCEDNIKQIPLSELGSGVELLFTILFLRQIASQSKGAIIYCIDEPELSLHPQWQKTFFEILKEEAKTKQVFISTHSLHFSDSSTLRNIKKLANIENTIAIHSLGEDLLNDPKTSDLFSLENRELLFAQSTVLVEGWEDRSRMRKFLQSQNNNLFVIDGLQNLERAKKVCSVLGIKFKAIVDLDYIRNFADLIPELTDIEVSSLTEIKELDQILSLITEEKLKKEITKVKNGILTNKLKALSSKIVIKMGLDTSYKTKVEAKIVQLKQDGIFVLPSGMLEDYLDEDGKVKSDTLGVELLAILKS
jgi:AAA15 family ATPase/GTPase